MIIVDAVILLAMVVAPFLTGDDTFHAAALYGVCVTVVTIVVSTALKARLARLIDAGSPPSEALRRTLPGWLPFVLAVGWIAGAVILSRIWEWTPWALGGAAWLVADQPLRQARHLRIVAAEAGKGREGREPEATQQDD